MFSKKKYLEEVLENVNVATQTKERLLQQSGLAAEMLDQLGDKHSMGFYRKVAQIMPEEAVFAVLSEVKDARLTGRLNRSPGAYFTYLIKLKAQELRLEL